MVKNWKVQIWKNEKLKSIIKYFSEYGTPYDDDIIELVGKEIAKKAEYHHKANGECALTICPNCDNRLTVTRFAFPLDKYCKECGQHYVVDIEDWNIEE